MCREAESANPSKIKNMTREASATSYCAATSFYLHNPEPTLFLLVVLTIGSCKVHSRPGGSENT
jgi:hypothetical protein